MTAVIAEVVIAAALAHGVAASPLVCTVNAESGGNPHNRANPPYVGLMQLGPGMQRRFYAAGYDDLDDPAQQANFAAEIIVGGGAGNWAGTWYRCGGR